MADYLNNQVHMLGLFNREEQDAADTITPGMLIELNSDGDVIPHATEGGYAELMFAEIDPIQGNGLEDDYASGDVVAINVEYPGSETQAFLKAGEDVSIGDKLISAGDGTLIANGSEASGTTVRKIIGVAREALDLSGSGAVDTLMRIRTMA